MGHSPPLVSPLLGIWSNLYAANLQDSLYWSSEPSQFWDRWAQAQASLGRCLSGFVRMWKGSLWGWLWGMVEWLSGLWESTEAGIKVQGLLFPERCPTSPPDCADKEQVPLLKIEEPPTMASRMAEFFTDLLTRRPLAQASHNFLHGLHFHKDYFQHPYFSFWKGVRSSPPGPSSPKSSHRRLSLGSLVQTPALSNPSAPSPESSVPWPLEQEPLLLSMCWASGPVSGLGK